MALPNFFSQKNCINSLGTDVSGLKTYADALNECAASLNACWVGNIDKQYVISAINQQIQAVNTQRQDVNWVQQTADFVLGKLNELGALTGFSQPHIPSIASIHFMGGCAAKTRIDINTGSIRTAAKVLNNKRTCLVDSKNHLARAVNVIDVFILGIWTIGAKITVANKQIDALLNRHDQIVAALRKIADIYDQADHRLSKKAGEVQSPGLLNPTPYSYLNPAVMELIKRVAKDLYDKIEKWLHPTGQEIKKEDKPIVVILNPQPKPETDADGFETIPNAEPTHKPSVIYTKDDAGKKVTDLSRCSRYQKSGQCVAYAYDRAGEVLGVKEFFSSGASAKDIPDSAKTWISENSKTDLDGAVYRILNGENGQQYKVKSHAEDSGVSIQTNSWVTFTGSEHGHVVFVESVQIENGKKYIYYSEGNWEPNGTLKRLAFDDFLTLGGKKYSYQGCITFDPV